MSPVKFLALAFSLSGPAALAQPISPVLVGTNHWYQLDGAKAEALRPFLADSGIRLIRIGGNGYNKTWPGDATVGRWVDYARANGAEPLVQISALATAEQAAETVRFFNAAGSGRAPVKRWAIGNEPDLDKWPTERTHEYVLRLAAAMKAADPTIRIYAPDLAGPHFEHLDRLVGGDLDITGAKLGDVFLIDGITWHRYAFWRDFTRAEAEVRIEAAFHAPIRKLRALMARADAKHGRTGDQALTWGLGEFNLHVVVKTPSNPERYQSVEGVGVHSFFNGQFFAELYGLCMAEQAEFAASWSIHESNGNRGTTDFGLFDGPGTAPVPRSSYHHTRLVAQNFRGEHRAIRHAVANVAAYAAINGDTTTVMLINKDERQARTLRLHFDGVERSGGEALTLATPGASAPALRRLVADVTLPAQSTQVLVYGADGGLRKRIDYALADAQAQTPPREQTFSPESRPRAGVRGPR